MTKQDAIEYFGGTQDAVAKALGIAQSSVAEWGEYPPGLRQVQIEMLSKKKLRAEPDVFETRKSAA